LRHPQLSRYEALKLAFRDWALGHGYLDAPLEETEVFPKGRGINVSRADRAKAGGMLDHFIADKATKSERPPD
jgi:hypothetical protein